MGGYNRSDAVGRKKSYWPMALVLLAILAFVNRDVFIAAAIVAALVFGIRFFVRGRR